MRVRTMLKWSTVVAVVALVAGPAIAQTGTRAPAAPSVPSAQVGFARREELTTDQMLVNADKMIAHIKGAADTVKGQLAKARSDRDVVKTLCLNDKVSQLGMAAKSAPERKGALDMAAKRKDSKQANHEYTLLVVLRDRANSLSAEANACIGEESSVLSQTNVSMVVDGTIGGGDDVTKVQDPNTNTGISPPPQCSSCVR